MRTNDFDIDLLDASVVDLLEPKQERNQLSLEKAQGDVADATIIATQEMAL